MQIDGRVEFSMIRPHVIVLGLGVVVTRTQWTVLGTAHYVPLLL